MSAKITSDIAESRRSRRRRPSPRRARVQMFTRVKHSCTRYALTCSFREPLRYRFPCEVTFDLLRKTLKHLHVLLRQCAWAPTSGSRLDALLRSPPIQDSVSMRLAYSPFLAHVCYRGLSATLRKVHALRESGSLRVAQFPSIARAHAAWSLERTEQRTENCARGCFLTLPQPLAFRSRTRVAVNLQLRPSMRAIRN